MITNWMRFEKFFNTPISIKLKFKIVMIKNTPTLIINLETMVREIETD